MNRVCLTGRLTRDPEIKIYDANKSNICTFTLAVDIGRNATAFIVCKSFGEKADLMAKTLTKGSLISVDGKLDQTKIELQDGTNKVITSVLIDQFDYLEKKKEPQVILTPPKEDPLLVDDTELPFL